MPSFEQIVEELVQWLALAPSIIGCAVSMFYLGRSKWAALLAGGFGVHALVLVYYRLAIMAIRNTSYQGQFGLRATLALATLVGTAASLAVVGGVVGLLSESVKTRERSVGPTAGGVEGA
jgi:hypothetical protein